MSMTDGRHWTEAEQMTERLLLRPAEVAESIGVSRARAYELIAAGEIPSVKIGTSIRVSVQALRAWIDGKVTPVGELTTR